MHEGTLTVRTGATLTPITNLPDETARRIRGLIKVRDAVREVLRTQIQDAGDEARSSMHAGSSISNTMSSSRASAR